MKGNVKRFPTAAIDPVERRSHFRVLASLSFRLRMAPEAANQVPAADLVSAYEDLASSATRYRKEMNAAGRSFIDKTLALLDRLVGEVVRERDDAGWSDEALVEANISAGGIGYVGHVDLPIGADVEVWFTVLSHGPRTPFRARGVVRRVAPEGEGVSVGIEFVDMSTSARERLVRLVFDLQRVELRRRSDS